MESIVLMLIIKLNELAYAEITHTFVLTELKVKDRAHIPEVHPVR